MNRALRTIEWAEAAPRMIVDFVLVYLSLFLALAVSVAYQSTAGNTLAVQELARLFVGRYIAFFAIVSPVFPIVFLLSGFYSFSRTLRWPDKVWTVVRGVGLSVLMFLFVSFIFFGADRTGRSVTLPFLVFATASVIGVRYLKAQIELRSLKAALPGEIAKSDQKKVLVIGGAGYIGSFVIQYLLQKGRQVRVLDCLVYGSDPLSAFKDHPDFELMPGDCRNIQDVVKAFRGVSQVIHLAAIVGDPACDQDRQTALEINYAATRMIAEIARANSVERLIFASSCSVYGSSDVEVDESSELNAISLYAKTKVDSEKALLESAGESFHPVILRFATVFGLSRRPRFDLVVNLLSARAHQEGLITIYNGHQWRPFIHVKDLARSIVVTLEAPRALVSGEIFNVGDSRLNHTLSDVAGRIRKHFPSSRVEEIDNSDARNYRVSFRKIRDRLRFECHYSLDDGIAELKAAFDAGVIPDYRDVKYNNQRHLQSEGSPANKNDLDARVMAAFASKATGA